MRDSRARGATARGSRPARAARPRRPRPRGARARRRGAAISATWAPAVWTGSSALSGSWKIIASRPRRAARVRRPCSGSSLAVEHHGAGVDADRLPGAAPSRARSVRLLPRPGLADDAERAARARRANETPSTTRAAPVADRRHARARGRAPAERRRGHCGRSRSASPSPISERLRPVSTTAIPGHRRQRPVRRQELLARRLIIVPQSGVGGWTPRPR